MKIFFRKIIGNIYFQEVLKKLEKNPVFYHYKSPKVINGNAIAKNYSQKNINSLTEVEFQIFSQFGDDGIIQWLIQNLPIKHKTFIEFGVEDYTESNTRFLLVNNYWSGLVIDGSKPNVQQIKSDPISSYFDIQALHSFITAENINELIQEAKFHEEVGILSIDVDGNDYWIWKAIHVINPVIVIIEYNSFFGFNVPFTIPYQSNFVRGISTPIGYWGASLLSLSDLANEKGYSFVGCNSAGNNAYFIRNDFIASLPYQLPSLENGFVFGIFSEVKSNDGEIIRGIEKMNNIHQHSFFNTRTQTIDKFDAEKIISELKASDKLNRF